MTRQEKINYIVEERMVYTVDTHGNMLDFNEANVRASLDIMEEKEMDSIISVREKAEALGAGSEEHDKQHNPGYSTHTNAITGENYKVANYPQGVGCDGEGWEG